MLHCEENSQTQMFSPMNGSTELYEPSAAVFRDVMEGEEDGVGYGEEDKLREIMVLLLWTCGWS